jgi:uncharacterized protein (DUF697 family)
MAPRTSLQRNLSSADQFEFIRRPFSLGEAPPYAVNPDLLLRQTLHHLPSNLRHASSVKFEAGLLSREACLLTLHAFWYTYCALLQDDSLAEQTALLRLMSQVASLPETCRPPWEPLHLPLLLLPQEMARLMLRTKHGCNAAFLDRAPLVIAVTVVSGLIQIVGLPLTPAYAHSIFQHLAALLGGRPAEAELSSWLAQASATAAGTSTSASRMRLARRSGTSAPELLAEMLSSAVEPLRDETETRRRTRVGQEAARRGGKSGRLAAGGQRPEATRMPLAAFELPPLLRFSAVEEQIQIAQAELRMVPHPARTVSAHPNLRCVSANRTVESTTSDVSRGLPHC